MYINIKSFLLRLFILITALLNHSNITHADSPAIVCLHNITGQMRVKARCSRSESAVTLQTLNKKITGQKGDKGDTGAHGVQGTQGIQGVTGPKGDPGNDAPLPLGIYDINNQRVGAVLQVGCPLYVESVYDAATTALLINERLYFVCIAKSGFTAYTDILFASSNCTGTAYQAANLIPSNGDSLFAVSQLVKSGSTALLYAVDYQAGTQSITYNSFLSATDGGCHVTTSGPYSMRPLTLIKNLSAEYTAPFEVK
jgi:hypothetical protein